MDDNEIIADRLEAGIHAMLQAFSEFDPIVYTYSLYYDPSRSDTWFVELFFTDGEQLETALENGTCYQVHQYLHHVYAEIPELTEIEFSLFFAHGPAPAGHEEYLARHLELIAQTEKMAEGAGEELEFCNSCNHPFGQHQLKGFPPEEGQAPTDGWITCPEPGCFCFLTWGANYQGNMVPVE